MKIVNGHTHIFDEHCVAEKYIGSKSLQKIVNTYPEPFIKMLDFLSITDKKKLAKYAAFVKNENKTMLQNFKELKSHYPFGTKFTVLTINMEGMGAGKVKKSYKQQLKEVIGIKQASEPILVFYHAVPEMEYCNPLLEEYIKKVQGIKIYPLMGHFPYHPTLMETYQYCSSYSLPVISHCAPINPTHQRDKKYVKEALITSRFPLIPDSDKSLEEMCSNFSHPVHLAFAAREFPTVNFCAAHMGGDVELDKFISRNEIDYLIGKKTKVGVIHDFSWTYWVLKYCLLLPNFYTDISYTFYSTKYQKFLKLLLMHPELKKKILFGTDYYMNKIETLEEDTYYRNLIYTIGKDHFNQIASINQEHFYKYKI